MIKKKVTKDEVKINEFKDDEMILQKRRKCRRITVLICLILTILAIVTMTYIFFINKNV